VSVDVDLNQLGVPAPLPLRFRKLK